MKKQVVLVGLTLILGVAIYLNVKFVDNGSDRAMDAMSSGGNASQEKILGEAKLVSASTESQGDYFSSTRVSRQKTRDEAVDLLNGIVENQKVDNKTKEKAVIDMTEIASQIEKEGNMENLIKAKGYGENVVLYNDKGVNVIVSKTDLAKNDLSKIKDIVVNETNVNSKDVKIIEVGNNTAEKTK